MKLQRGVRSLLAALLCTIFLFTSAYANSSWVWISETRPVDVLPAVIVITLAIEIAAINFFPRIHHLGKVALVVTIGNLLSFGIPYLLHFSEYVGSGFSFTKYLDHWPSYIVGAAYLFVTLVAELPFDYFLLEKYTHRHRTLLLTILLSNTVTTALTALAERLLCTGQW